jgi:hypothetical protein
MTTRGNNGQGLVEAALVLPVLLLLLAGGYVCCRAAFLHSAAESAAQTEALRVGRRLASLKHRISEDILPSESSVVVRSESAGKGRLLPAPFPSLAGRTRGIVEVRKGWEEAGRGADFPDIAIVRSSEASIDCWDQRSGSGKKIRLVIDGYAASGFFR